MAKVLMKGSGEVTAIDNKINDVFTKIDANVVDKATHNYGSYNVIMTTYEKNYGKTANKVCCTVLITGANDTVVVDAFVPDSYSAASMLSRFSWGQDEDFINVLIQTLNENDFVNQ